MTDTHARGTYQEPADFINENFSGEPPEEKVFWLKDEIKIQIEDILAHKYRGLRIRYWLKDSRSVWILKEIGKEQPITVGIVIENDQISKVKVLQFLESRGWEVRYPFFTKQFDSAALTEKNELDRPIDGISGATLSVRALTKLARIALLLNQHIKN